MVNYENGKVYKLYSPSKNIVYIGSTAEKYLSRRLQHHLSDYKKYKKNTHHYCKSFDVLECVDYKIELVEEVSCNNVEQLREREKYYILNNDCINKNIPNRNKKEYQKEWRNNNKEHFKEWNKNYNQKNKEYKKEYNKNYRQENKENLKEYKKKYGSQVIICECGCEITRWGLSNHTKTQKHIKLINNKSQLSPLLRH